MSISQFKKYIDHPDEYVANYQRMMDRLGTGDYWKKNPDLAITTGVGLASAITTTGLGLYTALNPDNQNAQDLANMMNTLNPVIDTLGEWTGNRHILGMGHHEAAYKAGLSGAGQFAGQAVTRALLPKDEEGNQNQLGIMLGGMGGEVVTDLTAEMSYPALAKKMGWAISHI